MRCATSRTIQSKHDSADIHVTGPLVVRGFESMAVSREHGSYKKVDSDSWQSRSNVTRCWEPGRPRLLTTFRLGSWFREGQPAGEDACAPSICVHLLNRSATNGYRVPQT